jgi:cellulose biosynthesis protein BcsQ
VDCPPAISLVSANVVTFADYILVPCLPDLLAFVGAKQTINFIESVGKFYHDSDFPLAKVLGVVLTQYDHRHSLDNTVEGDLEDLQNSGLVRRCFKSIPKDIKVKTAQVKRKLLSEGFANSNAAKAYRQLVQDMMEEIIKIESENSMTHEVKYTSPLSDPNRLEMTS